MRADRLVCRDFRNIESCDVSFDPEINLIVGENAQGKTSLIEAIWLFTGLRSFRAQKFGNLVRFGAEYCLNKLEFTDVSGPRRAAVALKDEIRSLSLDGVKNVEPTEYLGAFAAEVFTPSTIAVVDGEPEFRRRFLDQCLSQVSREYADCLVRFRRALKQRNASLKLAATDEEAGERAALWDDLIAAPGQRLMELRSGFCAEFSEKAAEYYSGLSSNREVMEINYRSRLPEGCGTYLEALEKTNAEDARRRTTGAGPHRDDVSVKVDSRPVRKFGSQGQKRSCAVAMKLASAAMLGEYRGESPVILLDDVLSELDSRRQRFILGSLGGGQIFITSCEPSTELAAAKAKRFRVESGRVTEE